MIDFLEDNSGAIDAIKEWISDQDNKEWIENIKLELPEDDEEEDGVAFVDD